MGIDLQAISITSCMTAIKSFFNSQENNSRWKDFSVSSEGLFLTRFLATILSNISYRLITSRRENYLSTAKMYSSVIGIAVNLGYSVFRGSNQKRTITILPYNNIVLNKYSVIGTYDSDYDIITLEDLSLVKNVNKSIKTVIGKVKTLSFTAGTNNIKLFSQFIENISEDIILYKDNIEVPITKKIKELVDDKYLVRSNPSKSVDILYVNNSLTGQYKYGTETVFTLKYIELANVPTIPFTTEMFLYGSLVNTAYIDNYVPFESIDSIKTSAPLNHETQNLIRSKPDYSKRVKEINTNVIEASFLPLTPTYTTVTYLKDDSTTLNSTELLNTENILNTENFFGTPLPDITPPTRERINLDIRLKLRDQFKDIADVNDDIENLLLKNFRTQLAQTINIYDIENLLDALSYVKYARVNQYTENRVGDKTYSLGDIITSSSNSYRATRVVGTTGITEPSWNLPLVALENIDTKLTTNDSGIIWQAYKRLNVSNIKQWQPLTKFKRGDFVYSNFYPNYMFKCIDLVKISASEAPDFTQGTLGSFIEDGQIVWVRKIYNASFPTRTNSTSYRIGDSVNVGTFSYECITYQGKTSLANTIMELPEYVITAKGSNYFEILGDYTNYLSTNDVINTLTNTVDIYSFSIASVAYTVGTNTTRVNVNQIVDLGKTYTKLKTISKGTIDGEIYWELTPDTTSIKYAWDKYNSFIYNLTIV